MCDKKYIESISNQVFSITLEDCDSDEECKVFNYLSKEDDNSTLETDDDLLCEECRREIQQNSHKQIEDMRKDCETSDEKLDRKKRVTKCSCSCERGDNKITKPSLCKRGMRIDKKKLFNSDERKNHKVCERNECVLRNQKCSSKTTHSCEKKECALRNQKCVIKSTYSSCGITDASSDERRKQASDCDFRKVDPKEQNQSNTCPIRKCNSASTTCRVDFKRTKSEKCCPKYNKRTPQSCDSSRNGECSKEKHTSKRKIYSTSEESDFDSDESEPKCNKKPNDCIGERERQRNKSLCSCERTDSLKRSSLNHKYHEKSDNAKKCKKPSHNNKELFQQKTLKKKTNCSCEKLDHVFDETLRNYEMNKHEYIDRKKRQSTPNCYSSKTRTQCNPQKRTKSVEKSQDKKDSQSCRKPSRSCESKNDAKLTKKQIEITKKINELCETFDKYGRNPQVKRPKSCDKVKIHVKESIPSIRHVKETIPSISTSSSSHESIAECIKETSHYKEELKTLNKLPQNCNFNKKDDEYESRKQFSTDCSSDSESYDEETNKCERKEPSIYENKDSNPCERSPQNCKTDTVEDQCDKSIKQKMENHNTDRKISCGLQKNVQKSRCALDKSKWAVCEKCRKRKDPQKKTKKAICADKIQTFFQSNYPVRKSHSKESIRSEVHLSVSQYSCDKDNNRSSEDDYQQNKQKACKNEKYNEKDIAKPPDCERPSEPKKDCEDKDEELPIRYKECKSPVCKSKVQNQGPKEDECDYNYLKVKEICERLKDIRKNFSAAKRRRCNYGADGVASKHNNHDRHSEKTSVRGKISKDCYSQACQTEFVCKCDTKQRKSSHCRKSQSTISDQIETAKNMHQKCSKSKDPLEYEMERQNRRHKSRDSCSTNEHKLDRIRQRQHLTSPSESNKPRDEPRQRRSCQRKFPKQQPDMYILKCTNSSKKDKLVQNYSIDPSGKREHEDNQFCDDLSKERLIYICGNPDDSNSDLNGLDTAEKKYEMESKIKFEKDFQMFKKNLMKHDKKQAKSKNSTADTQICGRLRAKIEKYCNCNF